VRLREERSLFVLQRGIGFKQDSDAVFSTVRASLLGALKSAELVVVVAAMYARGDIQSLGILYALSDQDLRCLWRRVRVNTE
jgi:hypothetical protein